MNTKITLVVKPEPKNIALAVFIFDGEKAEKHPIFKFLEDPEREYIRGIAGDIKPKEKEVKIFVLPAGRKIFAIGLGKKKDFSPFKAGLATRIAVQTAKRERIKKFAFWAEPQKSPTATRELFESVAANALLANFEFIKYKTPPEQGFNFVEEIHAVSKKINKDIREGLNAGIIIGEEVNNCRELANMPGGDMTPRVLAVHALECTKDLGIKSTILDEKKIQELGMGGVIGVSKGSVEPPRFIILEYMKGPKSQKPIVLVGKGVTFDTGGLNLKPSNYIYEMHMDMSGGAAVIHALRAAARLKLKKNIVALVPAAENMPSGSSYRPGDVLKTMSGKTVEVLNTDAEGRLILADALSYAKKFGPSVVIDIATLTGAAVVALGQRYSALFSNNRRLEELLRAIGEKTGDKVWPLPLSVDYEEEIRGTFADLANAEKTRYGGAIGGAMFLWQFIKNSEAEMKSKQKEIPWVHIDIAPRMTTIDGEYLAKGAAGASVMLLVRLLEKKS